MLLDFCQVDPDAILYAERLRGHLQWHVGQPGPSMETKRRQDAKSFKV